MNIYGGDGAYYKDPASSIWNQAYGVQASFDSDRSDLFVSWYLQSNGIVW